VEAVLTLGPSLALLSGLLRASCTRAICYGNVPCGADES
jgi:hypothetical protein